MTAYVFVLRFFPSFSMICAKILPPVRRGMSRMLTRKALVSTAARYSRTAMTIILRMESPRGGAWRVEGGEWTDKDSASSLRLVYHGHDLGTYRLVDGDEFLMQSRVEVAAIMGKVEPHKSFTRFRIGVA